MKKDRDFKMKILGIGAMAIMLGFNIRHAVNNYGITDGNMHMEVLAQSNSSSSGSGSGSGGGSGSGNSGGGSSGSGSSSEGDYPCSSGGLGAISCSVSVNVNGVLEVSCDVTCASGYYACCNAYHNKCQCRPN
jgi:hypothetical protein